MTALHCARSVATAANPSAGEFREHQRQLVDGIAGVGVALGPFAVDVAALFEQGAYRVAAERAGAFRCDGLDGSRSGARRRLVVEITAGEHERREFTDAFQLAQDADGDLRRGIQFERLAVELIFAHGRRVERRHAGRVARQRAVGQIGIARGDRIEHAGDLRSVDAQQRVEGFGAAGAGEVLHQAVDRLLRTGLCQCGVVTFGTGRGAHPGVDGLVLLFRCERAYGMGERSRELPGMCRVGGVEQPAQAVDVGGSGDAGQRTVGGLRDGGVRCVEQGEDLVRDGIDTPCGSEVERLYLHRASAVECLDDAFVDTAVEGQQRLCRGVGVRAAERGDQRGERLVAAQAACGADAGQSHGVVRRADGFGHRSGLRRGVTHAEPLDHVGPRLVAQSFAVGGDRGVDRVVGLVADVAQSGVAVLDVALFQCGEHVGHRSGAFGADDHFERRAAHVGAFAFEQPFGRLHCVACRAFVDHAVEQAQVGVGRGGFVTAVIHGAGCRFERLGRGGRAAGSQRGVEGRTGRVVGAVDPAQQDRFGRGGAFLPEGIGQRSALRIAKVAAACERQQGRFAVGNGDQRAQDGVAQIGVVDVGGQCGGIVGRRAKLQLRDEEGAVGVVLAACQCGEQPLAYGGAQLLPSGGGDEARHAVEGVLHGGVLALRGRDEHVGQDADAPRRRWRPVRP